MYNTSIKGFSLRRAGESDLALIMGFIRELAEYEKMLDEVETTEEILRVSMFEKNRAYALIAELDGVPVGHAIYCFNFSTFVGKAGLYLEDIYIKPEYRGRGFGKAIFSVLARIAVEEDCGRMEWSCLDWNAPSIEFYKKMGAIQMNGWTVHRLDVPGIESLAAAD